MPEGTEHILTLYELQIAYEGYRKSVETSLIQFHLLDVRLVNGKDGIKLWFAVGEIPADRTKATKCLLSHL